MRKHANVQVDAVGSLRSVIAPYRSRTSVRNFERQIDELSYRNVRDGLTLAQKAEAHKQILSFAQQGMSREQAQTFADTCRLYLDDRVDFEVVLIRG